MIPDKIQVYDRGGSAHSAKRPSVGHLRKCMEHVAGTANDQPVAIRGQEGCVWIASAHQDALSGTISKAAGDEMLELLVFVVCRGPRGDITAWKEAGMNDLPPHYPWMAANPGRDISSDLISCLWTYGVAYKIAWGWIAAGQAI